MLCYVNMTPIKISKLVKQNSSISSWLNEGFQRRVVLALWEHGWREPVSVWGVEWDRCVEGGGLIWVASWRERECAPARGRDAGKIGELEQAWCVLGTWIFLQGWWVGPAWDSGVGKKGNNQLLTIYYVPGTLLRALHQLGHLILSTMLVYFWSYLRWNWVYEEVICPVLYGIFPCTTTWEKHTLRREVRRGACSSICPS